MARGGSVPVGSPVTSDSISLSITGIYFPSKLNEKGRNVTTTGVSFALR